MNVFTSHNANGFASLSILFSILFTLFPIHYLNTHVRTGTHTHISGGEQLPRITSSTSSQSSSSSSTSSSCLFLLCPCSAADCWLVLMRLCAPVCSSGSLFNYLTCHLTPLLSPLSLLPLPTEAYNYNCLQLQLERMKSPLEQTLNQVQN